VQILKHFSGRYKIQTFSFVIHIILLLCVTSRIVCFSVNFHPCYFCGPLLDQNVLQSSLTSLPNLLYLSLFILVFCYWICLAHCLKNRSFENLRKETARLTLRFFVPINVVLYTYFLCIQILPLFWESKTKLIHQVDLLVNCSKLWIFFSVSVVLFIFFQITIRPSPLLSQVMDNSLRSKMDKTRRKILLCALGSILYFLGDAIIETLCIYFAWVGETSARIGYRRFIEIIFIELCPGILILYSFRPKPKISTNAKGHDELHRLLAPKSMSRTGSTYSVSSSSSSSSLSTVLQEIQSWGSFLMALKLAEEDSDSTSKTSIEQEDSPDNF